MLTLSRNKRMANMTNLTVQLLLSYIVGSIPFSIIAGKMNGIDIRQHGSGNAGGTNTFRVLGWKAGAIVTVLDIYKGFVASWYIASTVFIGESQLQVEYIQILCGFAAIIGHIFTIFARFKGGKGVATAAGMMIGLYPETMGIALLIFVIVLMSFKIVSLSSMITALSIPILLSYSDILFNKQTSDTLFYFSLIIAVLIVYTHKSNIKRMLNGTENKIMQKK